MEKRKLEKSKTTAQLRGAMELTAMKHTQKSIRPVKRHVMPIFRHCVSYHCSHAADAEVQS